MKKLVQSYNELEVSQEKLIILCLTIMAVLTLFFPPNPVAQRIYDTIVGGFLGVMLPKAKSGG